MPRTTTAIYLLLPFAYNVLAVTWRCTAVPQFSLDYTSSNISSSMFPLSKMREALSLYAAASTTAANAAATIIVVGGELRSLCVSAA